MSTSRWMLPKPIAHANRNENRRKRREPAQAEANSPAIADYFSALSNAGVLDGDQLRHRDELTRPLLGREPMRRDFTPDILRRAMKARIDEGRSARTANLLRQDAVALANWITAEGRANLSDFSKRAQRFNESLDRRKVRRPLLAIDADGRVADLHALRTTLCTNLARSGVAIQLAQRAMRHADPPTTQRHYTQLGLADVSIAFNALAAIELPTTNAATGTTDSSVGNHEKSGSSSGSSRRTKRHDMASLGENVSTKTPEIEITQPVTPREDTRRFDTRREVLLQFPTHRAISSVG